MLKLLDIVGSQNYERQHYVLQKKINAQNVKCSVAVVVI